MRYTTLCYLENPAGEYLMLHRVKKENDCNRSIFNARRTAGSTSAGATGLNSNTVLRERSAP